MGCKEWVAAGVIIFAVGVPTAHGHDLHLHVEQYVQLRTTDNIGMVQTTGPVTKDGQERVGVGFSERAHLEKIDK